MASDTRPSRSRLSGQRRPWRLLTRTVSPSIRYQMTAWCGDPSSLTVAIEAQLRALRNDRTSAGMGLAVGIAPMVREAAVTGTVAGRWVLPPALLRRGDDSPAPGARRADGLARHGCPECEPARRIGRERRLAQQVALAQVHAQLLERREVGPLLDAFGEQPRPDPPAERHEGLDEGLLGIVTGDAVGDLAVDLDDRRPKGGDEREAGVAGAGVVDGEAEAEAAE